MAFKNKKLLPYVLLSESKKELLNKAVLEGKVECRFNYPDRWMTVAARHKLTRGAVYRIVDDGSFKNKKKKKFKNLSPKKMKIIVDWISSSGTVKSWTGGRWQDVEGCLLDVNGIYKYNPVDTTKELNPSKVDWDRIPERYNWVATDNAAGTWAYVGRPTKKNYDDGDWEWEDLITSDPIWEVSGPDVQEAKYEPIERPKK